MNYNEKGLINLVKKHLSQTILHTQRLPQSGSHRLYVRLFLANGQTVMGAYNEDVKENEAFFSFTQSFLQANINVPRILAISEDRMYYLLTDLGDETLYQYLSRRRRGKVLPNDVYDYYRTVIQQLPRIQVVAKKHIDFSVCYPRPAFDRQSMQWDLSYFKYYFLKLFPVAFDEQLLEEDFNQLIHYLMEVNQDYFLYRDFQSRNVMLRQGNVYFLDYQGGRKGALQYDLASLLYDAKAALSEVKRKELLNYYLDELSKYEEVHREEFIAHYYAFVLIRILQALGTYGYRGMIEHKMHFVMSIPYAMKNLKHLIDNNLIKIELPELKRVLRALIAMDWQKQMNYTEHLIKPNVLNVVVDSFSYKKSIPFDYSGNGGGFVFDCRFLPNPGREAQYKKLTGKDTAVKAYLEDFMEVMAFRTNVFAIVESAIDNYLRRQFTHLTVHFGCTGGQHRSVYFAEALAQHIAQHYPKVNVILQHTNL